MTLYRRYRPQKIEEIDLTEVREALGKIAASPSIPHAFLFAGPKGGGKTSAARILAKVVNCENIVKRKTQNAKRPEPCNKCEQCTAITKGASLNVIEIDAASHRGVDDIRALRETVKLSPAGGRMKVYIIDEAHMLTTEAGNALLKTLEEPPSHALFILATTAPEKLLDTIRSRCTTILFRRGKPEEIVRALERAVKGEGLKAEKGAIERLAKNVDGSFREAHKILEQLALGGGKINQEAVNMFFELAATNPQRLPSLLAEKDAKGALEEIGKIVEKGANLKLYTSEIVRILRLSLLSKIGVYGEGSMALKLGIEETKTLIELFSEAARQLPTAVIPQLPLEIAVVKWCGEEAQSAKRKAQSKEGVPTIEMKSSGTDTRGHIPVPGREGKELEDDWREIMRRVKAKNHSAEALLRATRPTNFDGRNLEIEVFYQFHKERIEKEPYRSLVEDVAGQILGGSIRLVCNLSSSGQKAVDLVNITEEVEEDIIKVAEEVFGNKNNHIN